MARELKDGLNYIWIARRRELEELNGDLLHMGLNKSNMVWVYRCL
jgi:hypothetical protein